VTEARHATPTPSRDDRVLDTPTAAGGDGFDTAVALATVLALAVVRWRR